MFGFGGAAGQRFDHRPAGLRVGDRGFHLRDRLGEQEVGRDHAHARGGADPLELAVERGRDLLEPRRGRPRRRPPRAPGGRHRGSAGNRYSRRRSGSRRRARCASRRPRRRRRAGRSRRARSNRRSRPPRSWCASPDRAPDLSNACARARGRRAASAPARRCRAGEGPPSRAAQVGLVAGVEPERGRAGRARARAGSRRCRRAARSDSAGRRTARWRSRAGRAARRRRRGPASAWRRVKVSVAIGMRRLLRARRGQVNPRALRGSTNGLGWRRWTPCFPSSRSRRSR